MRKDGFTGWKRACLKRDNGTCQRCGKTEDADNGIYMCAHHKASGSLFKDIRTDPRNGITLCRLCHDFVHAKNGKEILDRYRDEALETFGIDRRGIGHVYCGGRVSLGYKWEGDTHRIIVDESQTGLVSFIFAEFARTRSLEAVSQVLVSGGYGGRRIRKARPCINRIIRNSIYRGKWQAGNGQIVTVPVFVPADTLKAVDDALSRMADRPQRSMNTPAVFAGILKCSVCDAWLSVHIVRPRRNGRAYKSYLCPQRKACGNRRIIGELKLIAFVQTRFPGHEINKEFVTRYIDYIIVNYDDPDETRVVMCETPVLMGK